MQHFQKEKTLHKVNKGRRGRQSPITPEKREQVCKSVNKSPKKILPNPCPRAGYVSNYTFESHEERPETVPISTHHVLQQQDKKKRIEMCNWLNEKLEQTPSWLNHISFSDEAHFHLNGAVNKHNNVFWGESSPEEISEKHLKGHCACDLQCRARFAGTLIRKKWAHRYHQQ